MASINPEIQHSNGKFKAGISGNPSGRPKDNGYMKMFRSVFTPELLMFLRMATLVGRPVKISENKDVLRLIQNKDFKRIWRKYSKSFNWSEEDIAALSPRDVERMINRIEDRLIGRIEMTKKIESKNVNHNFDTSIEVEFIEKNEDKTT